MNYINGQVPAGDWVVIGGDFNTGSRTEAAVTTLSSVVVNQPARLRASNHGFDDRPDECVSAEFSRPIGVDDR